MPDNGHLASAAIKDAIIIRPYRAADLKEVQTVFRQGMESLIPRLWKQSMRSPTVMLPILTASMALGTVARRVTGDGSTGMVTGLGVLSSAVFALYRIARSNMLRYISMSLADDLRDIERVYKDGCFFVAQDTLENKIVGTVAGEHKGDNVYELRRMSVASVRQGAGLGRRLVAALEIELQPNRIFLVCGDVQRPAMALYTRCGFRIRERYAVQGFGWVFRHSVYFLQFEKDYA